MSSKKISKLVALASLMLLGACRFLSDNQAPEEVLRLSGMDASGGCTNIKDAWSRVITESEDRIIDAEPEAIEESNDAEESEEEEDDENTIDEPEQRDPIDATPSNALSYKDFQQILLCHIDAYEKKFDSLKMPRPEGLYPEEVAAIAREFFLKDKPLRTEEISVIYLVKAVLLRSNDSTLSKQDLKLLREIVIKHGVKIIRDIHIEYYGGALEVILDRTGYPNGISLRPEHLAGLSYVAERFVAGLDLSKLRPRMTGLISALNPLLGYSSTMTRLPLSPILNKLGDFYKRLLDIDAMNQLTDEERELDFGLFAPLYRERVAQLRGAIKAFAHQALASTGFAKGAVLQTSDWKRLLESFDGIEWKTKNGPKSFNFNLPTAQMAQVIQVALTSFSGRQDASRLQSADIQAIVVDALLTDKLRGLSYHVRINDSELESKLSALGFPRTLVDSYRSIRDLLRPEYESESPMTVTEFWKFPSTHLAMRLIQSLHVGFDSDRDGLLDMSRDLDQNEFRELLKMADKILIGVARATAPDETDEDKEKNKQPKSSDIDALLSSKKSSLVLSVFADNMTLLSKGDGAINAGELYLLVEELQSIQSIQSAQKEIEKLEQPAFAGIHSLLASSTSSPLYMRDRVFRSHLIDAIGNPSYDPEPRTSPACRLQALDRSHSFGEIRDNYFQVCQNNENWNADEDLKLIFDAYKPWLNRVKTAMPIDRFLTNDEMVLASLLTTWIENIALVDRAAACVPEEIPETDRCLPPMSRDEFETAARTHLGPSSLRLLPPKLRAPLLAANLSPEKILSRALFAAPEILKLARSGDTSNAALSKLLTLESVADSKRLGYADLVYHAWALSQVMFELGNLTNN